MPFAGPCDRVAPARSLLAVACGIGCLLGGSVFPLQAADLDEARQQFIQGHYSNCVHLCEQAIGDQEYGEEWRLLLIQSMMTLGQYTNALSVLTHNLERYSSSLRLRLAGREVFLYNNQKQKAEALVEEAAFLVRNRAWAYRTAADLVTVGQAALLMGIDPREVLDQLFDRAKKADPACREVYLATGEVALDKGDYALAAKTFAEGLNRFPEDPDLHFGLARAYAISDRRQMIESLDTALNHNTNHVPSYLLLADHLIDGEEYTAADKILQQVLTVNPWQPEAWAYRAVIAHLRNDGPGERQSREKALLFWKTNPKVDHLIGEKLSRKYRFAEGAAAQRQALQFETNYLPARIQLAQDLLRLGEENEGWALAEEVHRADAYDVTAYNLGTLHDSLARFQTLTNHDFILRMSRREAAIYGPQALALLQRAKAALCAKYGMELTRPTIIEIFPEQKDFGVRTFGLPGNPGFLGVCFGSVITANSPASQAHPASWQAVLWHEFCHVVTLNLTHNKMPRWLSEGISVYEERQANPAWGQAMNPRYREMVLGKDLTPVGRLSASFLAPKTDLHLQFAYFESALVVEFLVSQFGSESLQQILRDLGSGVEINQAIAAHTAPMEKIEKDFRAFALQRAEALAPGLDWEKPGEPARTGADSLGGSRALQLPVLTPPPPLPLSSSTLTNTVATNTPVLTPPVPPAPLPPPRLLAPFRRSEAAASEAEWLSRHPTNYYGLTRQAKKLLAEKKLTDAKAPLRKLVELYPSDAGPDNAHKLLAEVHRGLNETNLEREVLGRLASLDADDVDTFLRLMELCSAARDWSCTAQNAERFLAVNPLLAEPYRYLASASEALGRSQPAIQAYQTMLLLDPPDPTQAHYRLARLLRQAGDPAAKRHVLQALEEAPRFRDAHKLLLAISDDSQTKPESPLEGKPQFEPKPKPATEKAAVPGPRRIYEREE